MKLLHVAGITLVCGALLFGQTSCSMSNTGKGSLIGGAGGGALGAGIGALIGGGKGAAIGAGVGAAVGAGAGALIGHKMDKQQRELEAQLANQAKVEQTTDANGLQGIRVTFDGGILFPTGKATINEKAKKSLKEFANSIINNPGTDITIAGFTDNTGTMEANERVATERSNAVLNYLKSCGVPADRMTAKAYPMQYYIATNDTPEGRALNRRVEIYITAGDDMIKEAEAGTLK